jgi:hypothetical protein
VVAARRRRSTLALAGTAALLALACAPTLDQTISIISKPTVLAVRSDPPEAAVAPPDDVVTMTALYVDGNGAITSAPIDWAFCTARNPLANLGPVNPECLQASGSWFVPVGVGLQATGTIPANACRQFGPDVPQPMPGQPQGRPVDPDSTGGYYQPIRVLAPGTTGPSTTIGDTRLSCGLANAVGNVSVVFAERYHVNTNTAVTSLSVSGGASAGSSVLSTDVNGATNPVQAGTHIALSAAWAACPTVDVCGDGFCGPDETAQSCPSDCMTPKGCTGAERYAGFDLETQTVVDQREAIAVAWFATGGAFDRYDRDQRQRLASTRAGWARSPVGDPSRRPRRSGLGRVRARRTLTPKRSRARLRIRFCLPRGPECRLCP